MLDLTRDRIRRRLAPLPSRAKSVWYLHGATEVGPGIYLKGRPFIKDAPDLRIGANVALRSEGRRIRFSGGGQIIIDDWTFLNAGCFIEAFERVAIGHDVAVSHDVFITDTDSHGLEGRPIRVAPVEIGPGAWIGARAIILPGVTVGRRAVVAAGAIVTRDVPDDTLVAGQPARPLRSLHYPDGIVRAWS
jgi:acetyltransferase-like isoleucine patch superfamily enzyme